MRTAWWGDVWWLLFLANILYTPYLFQAAHLSHPPSWVLRSEETWLSVTAFIRSFQLCGSILVASGWLEFLPCLADSLLPPQLLSPLTALSTSQRATTFVSYQRERRKLTFQPTWLGLNRSCLTSFLSLCLCAWFPTESPVLFIELNYNQALNYDWLRLL